MNKTRWSVLGLIIFLGSACTGLPFSVSTATPIPPTPLPPTKTSLPPTLASLPPTQTPLPSPTVVRPSPTPTRLQSTVIIQFPVVTRTATPAVIGEQQIILSQASEVLGLLKKKDMVKLTVYVSQSKGVRFSPYAYVKATDRVLSSAELKVAFGDPRQYVWGQYDGSGQPIKLVFGDYYNKFVYSTDFAKAEKVGFNQTLGKGNTPDNSREFYPGAHVVEYHFPGFDPKYGGMDWQSLRLVFQKEKQTWYLVGIIHASWTI